jgi:protein-tyrosine phosphatase
MEFRSITIDRAVFDTPGDALQALRAVLGAGGKVYLHCMAGIGRTSTVAACLLVEQGFTAAEALALLQRKWQVADQRRWAAATPETEAQRDFIRRWPTARC